MRLSFLLSAALLTTLAFAPTRAAAEDDANKLTPTPKHVDLVLCLDTSGSMNGLINAAREKLWKVVEEIAMLKPTPNVRVALLTYGSPGNQADGHVIMQTSLTQDLDLLNEKLFALTTRGGTELVGRAMHTAIQELPWSSEPGLKVMFIAGNESADQDRQHPFEAQAAIAKERGIIVNSVYCGGADDADAGSWRHLAALSGGRFNNIDHNNGTVQVKTPFDVRLGALSREMNKTYLFYGAKRAEVAQRQRAQDDNAEAMSPGVAADRATAKAGSVYRIASDLIDAMTKDGFDLAKIKTEELPESMRKMTIDERKAHLTKLSAERTKLSAEVAELTKQRNAFIRDEMKRQSLDDTKSLDRALRAAIREQAAKQGFTIPDAK